MPPTTIYKQGDVVLVPFPFVDNDGEKKRPALIISANWYNSANVTYVMAAITSSIPVTLARDQYHIRGRDVEDAGLTKDSIVRCGTLFTIDRGRVHRKLGAPSRGTFDQILQLVYSVFKD